MIKDIFAYVQANHSREMFLTADGYFPGVSVYDESKEIEAAEGGFYPYCSFSFIDTTPERYRRSGKYYTIDGFIRRFIEVIRQDEKIYNAAMAIILGAK